MGRKHRIVLDASELKLVAHPRGELCVKASEIQAKNSEFAKLFPEETKPTITYIQGISFTLNTINKNDCLILAEEGMESYPTLVNTPLDIEHDRQQIVGFALKAFLCNVKNSKVLSEDAAWEILDNKGIVNVGAVWGIWRINSEELDSLIQENFDSHSRYFDSVKLSFEYYFDEFDFFVSEGQADYPNGKIVSGDAAKNPQAEEMYRHLRIYEDERGRHGDGLWEGNRISIVPRGGSVEGNAVTFRPANVFSDLLAKKNGDEVLLQKQESEGKHEKSKNITLTSVNSNEALNMEKDKKVETKEAAAPVAPTTPVAEPAKPVSVEASTPPQLTVDKDVAQALQVSLDKKIEELGAKDKELSDLKASVESMQTSLTDAKNMSVQLQSKYDEAMAKLNKIEADRVESEKRAKIAERMAKLASAIEITDDNRALLEAEASSLSDDDFAKKVAFYSKLSKKVDASVKTEESVSVKTTVQEVVTQAAEKAPKGDVVAAPPARTLAEQFKEAFGKPENFGFKTN